MIQKGSGDEEGEGKQQLWPRCSLRDSRFRGDVAKGLMMSETRAVAHQVTAVLTEERRSQGESLQMARPT